MGIWMAFGMVVLFVLVLFNAELRKSLLDVIKAVSDRRILTLVSLMLLYIAGVVGILYTINLWHVSLLKDTILWFLFTGVVLAFSQVTSNDEENVFSSIFTDSLKVIILFEFLVNTYTFPLAVELILMPIATVVVLVGDLARRDKSDAAIATLMSGLQVVIGFSVLLYAAMRAISEFHDLWTINTVHSLLLAPLLSLLFVPFIYLVLVYIGYDSLFVRLRVGCEKERALQRYTKRRLIMHLGVNLTKIRAFYRAYALDLMRIQTRGDLDKLL